MRQANDIYLDTMRPFIIHHLKKVPGETVETLIAKTLTDEQKDKFWAILDKEDNIEAAIDFNYFPLIVRDNWIIEQNNRQYGFGHWFDWDMTVQNMLWLIKDARNACEHRGTKDLDFEFVRINLFLIADVLGKINRPNQQHEVETIRNKLDDIKERLAEAKERLEEMEAENAEYKQSLSETQKRLTDAESQNSKYEKDTAELSKQVDEKENRIKKLLKQQKEAKAQNEKSKKDVAEVKKRLEKSEAAQTDYKQRLETIAKELKATEKAARTSEENLKTTSNQLKEAVDEWMASLEGLTATPKLFTIATIGSQEIQKMFPAFEIDSAVRILDRRGTDKGNYLSRLLDQKQPTIIYVQSENKIHQLLDLVGPKKAAVIGKHNEQTSETEATEILKKLENRELIAAVSNTTFSELQTSDCVEHFVFCHLVPNVDEFFKRCQPAFASEKDSYLHLIYGSKQKIKELMERYPKDELLRKLYQKIRTLIPIGKLINFEDLHSELCKENELDMAKLGFETGLVIFEELGLLKKSGGTIKRLGDVRTELNKSKTYCIGAELRKEIENSPSFQYEHSIEQIWEKMLEVLNVDSKQILRGSSIHQANFRYSSN